LNTELKPKTASLPPALCLMGPTASGKTKVAVELAKNYPFEIISVDSALVYRGLDIGSGKPDSATLISAPHRLINIRDPKEAYSVANFRTDAIAAMTEINAAGKTPLLVGGTMMYFKILRDGLAKMPEANEEIRQEILSLAKQKGWKSVHQRLSEVDPESAKRIHPNDPQRLQRALEVYEITGKSMSYFREEERSLSADTHALPNQMHYIAIYPEHRKTLHKRIQSRFYEMLEAGFVEEVALLKQRSDLKNSLPAIRSGFEAGRK
jgi:tRNA dimethylallyltransferase